MFIVQIVEATEAMKQHSDRLLPLYTDPTPIIHHVIPLWV